VYVCVAYLQLDEGVPWPSPLSCKGDLPLARHLYQQQQQYEQQQQQQQQQLHFGQADGAALRDQQQSPQQQYEQQQQQMTPPKLQTRASGACVGGRPGERRRKAQGWPKPYIYGAYTVFLARRSSNIWS
jgi:hypothetical protein